MKLETNLIKYLPVWYRQILDYQQLCLTESEQFEGLAFALNNTGDNFFFQTADAGAISLWEQVLHIIPNLKTEDLDFRRTRVINRISTKPPFTLGFLYRKLDELIGPGLWTVFVDYPNYTLYIEASSRNQAYAEEVAFTIGRIKPAHIVYVNVPYLVTGIGLSETISTGDMRYHYRMGQWGLGLLPFADEGEVTVIKTSETPSTTKLLLTGTAQDIATRVAAARINGTAVVTGLVKSINNETAVIRYTIPPDIGPSVTRLELLDAKGNRLTNSTVFVPVKSNLQVKHSIPVTEVN